MEWLQLGVHVFLKPIPFGMPLSCSFLRVLFSVWPQRNRWEPMMSHSSVWSLCITEGSQEYRAALAFHQHTPIYTLISHIWASIKADAQTREYTNLQGRLMHRWNDRAYVCKHTHGLCLRSEYICLWKHIQSKERKEAFKGWMLLIGCKS